MAGCALPKIRGSRASGVPCHRKLALPYNGPQLLEVEREGACTSGGPPTTAQRCLEHVR